MIVIDDFTGAVDTVVAAAAELAPFPPAAGGYYPGLRRAIGAADAQAHAYVMATLNRVAPFIGGAFDADGLDLLDASFSMVTAPPESLIPPQRAPHFDSTDPNYIAILHYLGGCDESGTAFYRQRATGIEAVNNGNVASFVATAQRESAELSGYIHGSNPAFEQIGAVDAVPDRLIVYQGCLLHSGIIPPNFAFSADPRAGRLTANLFVKAWRK